jgi:hypothetical protein
MVVGQQTFGCGSAVSSSVDDLLAEYRSFYLGQHYRRTPFWQAARRLYRSLSPDGAEGAFLWTNLVKLDQFQSRPEAAVEDLVCDLRLLPAEMLITCPDVVVFFTGPNYDARLRRTFPGVVYQAQSREIAQLKHPGLPNRSYRTYHPAYLRRSRRWYVLDEIAALATMA